MPAGPLRVPAFPLGGALLFPRSQLPLHIFEPRYRAMVADALAGERLIAMIQPQSDREDAPLFGIGGLGRISGSEELGDGRYNIVLEGLGRFRLVEEVKAATPYRQIEIEILPGESDEPEPLSIAQRADLERESRRFADALGFAVDWHAVERLDDEMLVNAIAQVAPFDIGSKQALLEAPDMAERADLIVQMMQFQRLVPGGVDAGETLQ